MLTGNRFDATYQGSEGGLQDYGTLIDGTGTSYRLSNATSLHIARVVLPVRLVGHSDYSEPSPLTLSNLTLEVTRTNPIAGQAFSGRFATDGSPTALGTFGADVPGVAMAFNAGARFFDNFANGSGCARILITPATGTPFALTLASPSQAVSLIAPFTVYASPICVSTRNASSAVNDFELSASAITIGDPVR